MSDFDLRALSREIVPLLALLVIAVLGGVIAAEIIQRSV